MIEAIKEIGEYALKGKELCLDNFINNFCIKLSDEKPVKKNKKIQQRVVFFLNFDIDTKKIKIDSEQVNCENANGDSGKAYLWVGNSKGTKPQINITSDKLDNILTKTLPLIKYKIKEEFKKNIAEVVNLFFDKSNKKEYSIKPETFEFFDKKLEEIKEDANQIKDKLKEINTKKESEEHIKELKKLWEDGTGGTLKLDGKGDLEKVKQIIEGRCDELLNGIEYKLKEKYKKNNSISIKILVEDLLKSKGLYSGEISLYTIKINDKLVCQTKEYKDMLYYEKIGCLFDETNKRYKKNFNSQGICSICSDDAITKKQTDIDTKKIIISKQRDDAITKKQTTSNTTNLEYKFYMTDKVGFSFGLDKTFKKNLNLCKDCYQHLMIGERFIQDNLKTQIGELNVYIIPHFALKDSSLDIADFSKYVSYYTDSITTLKNIEDLEYNLKRYAKYEENNFVINYLFYQKSKSEFKVLKLIKDIPPTRLNIIREKEDEISNLVDEKYLGENKFKIDLKSIWGSIPLKQEKGKKTYRGTSRYLDVLDAIFLNGIIDYNSLINQFTEVIRIIRFEREGYNIRTKENFTKKILSLNFLLLFFKKLNILNSTNKYTINSTNKMENLNNYKTDEIKDLIPQEILNYWENIEIYGDNCKKALFLLGRLIGEIGYAQDNKDIKNRPVLNKITFQGMDVEKLKRLSNDVFEKLIQYDILKYNEPVHSAFKNLFEEHINNWNLSNQENVFYILSGYAFSGYIGFQRYKKRIEDGLKKKQEEIQEAKKAGKDVTEREKLLEEANRMFNSKEKDSYKKTEEILKNITIILKNITINNMEVK